MQLFKDCEALGILFVTNEVGLLLLSAYGIITCILSHKFIIIGLMGFLFEVFSATVTHEHLNFYAIINQAKLRKLGRKMLKVIP